MRSRGAKRALLAAIVATGAALWLVVLPRLAQSPSQQRHAADLRRLGVDPAALYYTDHARWRDNLQVGEAPMTKSQ